MFEQPGIYRVAVEARRGSNRPRHLRAVGPGRRRGRRDGRSPPQRGCAPPGRPRERGRYVPARDASEIPSLLESQAADPGAPRLPGALASGLDLRGSHHAAGCRVVPAPPLGAPVTTQFQFPTLNRGPAKPAPTDDAAVAAGTLVGAGFSRPLGIGIGSWSLLVALICLASPAVAGERYAIVVSGVSGGEKYAAAAGEMARRSRQRLEDDSRVSRGERPGFLRSRARTRSSRRRRTCAGCSATCARA